jgi:3-mercaptopyruvate sulfurtransferase SseA
MKKWISAAIPLLVLGLAMAGAAAQVDPNAGVTRITVDELKKLLKAGTVILVDVRSAEGYKAGHLPGSISIPVNDVPEKSKSLPKDKTIVTYCS